MKPERSSRISLAITRSKGKMYEYSIPEEHHISISIIPENLFPLSIGMLGDLSAEINKEFPSLEKINNLKRVLNFSAQFFDAYIQSRLNNESEVHVTLMAAAAYYLCDLPGSSIVYCKKILSSNLDQRLVKLERILLRILNDEHFQEIRIESSFYSEKLILLLNQSSRFFAQGGSVSDIHENLSQIRNRAYVEGTPEELFYIDVLGAVLKTKIKNSVWSLLPNYTQQDLSQWREAIRKETFIKEFWPSQKLLGENGVFSGDSAVIQMPTSSGKSKSIEVIIRSAFVSNRTHVCVVVAPFRALCHEITASFEKSFAGEAVFINELTDVYQNDFDTDFYFFQAARKQILILTPEKLVYILRQSPEIADNLKLVIFDEGHQFDSGMRGVTYELLLTFLKEKIPASSQKILISAVISNADAISLWLNGVEGKVIKGETLSPSFRSIGFASWTSQLGMISYVNNTNISEEDFFVPRVMEQQSLNFLTRRETSQRYFPDKENGSSIASYLGLKLVGNGAVAIFCGTKVIANATVNLILEAYRRGLNLASPSSVSNQNELDALADLYIKNFGENSSEAVAARIGILGHHANIPHGLRISTEHALREGFARFIICTSTLAQGVNLPIRYLIFTGIHQSQTLLKVRDFHNLIGRAGRAGMETEGTIIFADPEVYDQRNSYRPSNIKFSQIKGLLEAVESDPCGSSLLTIFDNFQVYKPKTMITYNFLNFLENFYADESYLISFINNVTRQFPNFTIDQHSLLSHLSWKLKIISKIEAHLMAMLTGISEESKIEVVTELAQKTLAYHLADDEKKLLLIEIFKTILNHISTSITDDQQKVYGHTLLGMNELIDIESWIEANTQVIISSSYSDLSLLEIIFPILSRYMDDTGIEKLTPESSKLELTTMWVQGQSYSFILAHLLSSQTKIIANTKRLSPKLSNVIDCCDSGIGYTGMLIIGAIAEIVESKSIFEEEVGMAFRRLQKKIKYGLPDERAIQLYEKGYCDRVIAQELKAFYDLLEIDTELTTEQKIELRRNFLEQYPSYFRSIE